MLFAVAIKKSKNLTGCKLRRRRVDVENRRTNKCVIMTYNVPQCTFLDCMQNNTLYILQKINGVQLNKCYHTIIPRYDKNMTRQLNYDEYSGTHNHNQGKCY